VTLRTPAPDLVFLCDWLPPEFGAVGQYSLQRAREIARDGRSVVLYGLSSSHDSVTQEGALRIVRLKAPLYDRTKRGRRAWWTLRTGSALVWRARGDIRRCRELMFTGSPPFLLHLLAPLNVFLRRTLVYRITDFFPEALMAERERPSRLLGLFHRLTLFWRRRVERFEVLGEDQRRRLLEAGVRPERIALRRDPSPVEITPSTAPLALPAALAGYKVLLYSGNFGVAHDYETFLRGYLEHHRRGSAATALWLNARGRSAERLEQALAAERVPVHRTQPLPLEELARLLVTPAAHLITLRAGFWGYVLPSKVYGCLASGRDIVYVGPRESDVHLLCAAAKGVGYWQIEPGDAGGVYRALEALAARP
jgi:hypothetical protein